MDAAASKLIGASQVRDVTPVLPAKTPPRPRVIWHGPPERLSRGLTRKDLEPLIGTRSRVAEVLNRHRSLSVRMIRRLHDGLGIPAEILIRPSLPASGAEGLERKP